VRAPTRIGLLAAFAVAIAAAPAQASVTLGDANASREACGSNQGLLQKTISRGPSYTYTSQTNGVIVSWSYKGYNDAPPNIKLRVYHPTADPATWFTRSESAQRTAGAGANHVHMNELNTFTESPGLPIQNGDVLGLTGSGGTGISCFEAPAADNSDVLCGHNTPDPPVGQNTGSWVCGALTSARLGVSAVVEPDADGDLYGDETQDSCPTDPAVHTGGCPVDLSIVKSASPNPRVGDDLVYGLSVKNNSTINPAAGVTVIDTLPAGVTFVSAVTSQGSCSGTTNVICALGTVAPSGAPGIAITVKPTAAGPLNNTASVTTTDNDTDTTNNSSSVLVNVAPPAPVVSKYKVSPSSQKFAKPGATISYSLNTAATTTHSVLKPARGIKSGKTCVKPPKKPPTGAKKCTRFVSIGSFKHTDVAGKNKFHWNGKLKGKKVKPGSYRLQAVARNASGKSAAKQVAFKIK
jgi:uncharacterized repeat protein (TIGR01451 family)